MRITALVLLLLTAFAFRAGSGKGISIEKKEAASGNHYTIIYQGNCKIEFTDKRPGETDKNVQLCVAGAFTQLTNYTIDGVYICKGTVGNKLAVNKRLGGGIKIINGQATIFPTQKGALLKEDFIQKLATQKGSFFQQIQLIENGKAASFVDKAVFQRRAIVTFKDGKTAIVENEEEITLAAFSKDLVELGAKDALYTDMGGWDEGWYKDPASGKKIPMGLIRSHTDKQSNWVLFRK